MENFRRLSSGLLVLFLLVASAAMANEFNEAPNRNFNMEDPALDLGHVIYNAQFVDVNNLGSIKDVLSSDYLQQAQHAIDSQKVEVASDKRVRKILVLKTAVRLQMPIANLLAKHMNEFSTLQKSMGFTYNPSCMNSCDIVQRIKYMGFLHVNVNLNLEVEACNLEQADAANQAILEALQVADAAYELRVFGRNWSNIFTETQSVSYYIPHNEKTVDVVTYQIVSIKDVSYSHVPGLENIIRSEMKNQTETMVNYLKSRRT